MALRKIEDTLVFTRYGYQRTSTRVPELLVKRRLRIYKNTHTKSIVWEIKTRSLPVRPKSQTSFRRNFTFAAAGKCGMTFAPFRAVSNVSVVAMTWISFHRNLWRRHFPVLPQHRSLIWRILSSRRIENLITRTPIPQSTHRFLGSTISLCFLLAPHKHTKPTLFYTKHHKFFQSHQSL
jgi:hypothetical protein